VYAQSDQLVAERRKEAALGPDDDFFSLVCNKKILQRSITIFIGKASDSMDSLITHMTRVARYPNGKK
jgi:hypothetical protein